jgi:hypothetical protein
MLVARVCSSQLETFELNILKIAGNEHKHQCEYNIRIYLGKVWWYRPAFLNLFEPEDL